MTFSATVKTNTHLHKGWARSNLVTKTFHGARFVRQRDGSYLAEGLEPKTIDDLSKHPNIVVFAITDPAGIVEPVSPPSLDVLEETLAETSIEASTETTKRPGRPKKVA